MICNFRTLLLTQKNTSGKGLRAFDVIAPIEKIMTGMRHLVRGDGIKTLASPWQTVGNINI